MMLSLNRRGSTSPGPSSSTTNPNMASDIAIKGPASVRLSQLARIFWRQWVALGVLFVLLAYSETLNPYRHVMYNETDEEIWRYSAPLMPNTVPPSAVPLISVLTPLLVIAAYFLTGQITILEAHHAAVSTLTCVMFTGITTNFIKVNVGRFRPHFVARCWPEGGKPIFEADGRPKCSDSAVKPMEGMKSFPSGHTAWSTAGLAWSSFFLLGKLNCFNGGGPIHLVQALLPLGGSIWIGASRMQDYWHHWEDVAVGFLLGLLMAHLFYRTTYCNLMSPQSGTLLTNSLLGLTGTGQGTGASLLSTGSSGGLSKQQQEAWGLLGTGGVGNVSGGFGSNLGSLNIPDAIDNV